MKQHRVPLWPCRSCSRSFCPLSPESECRLLRRGDSAHRHRDQTWGQMSQLQGEEKGRQRCRDSWPAAGEQASGWDWLQHQQVDWPPFTPLFVLLLHSVSFNSAATFTSKQPRVTAHAQHCSLNGSRRTFFFLFSVLISGLDAPWWGSPLTNRRRYNWMKKLNFITLLIAE